MYDEGDGHECSRMTKTVFQNYIKIRNWGCTPTEIQFHDQNFNPQKNWVCAPTELQSSVPLFNTPEPKVHHMTHPKREVNFFSCVVGD